MQLAHDHVAEMMKTHHINSFTKMVLQIPPIFTRGDLREPQGHRSLTIDWWIGKEKYNLVPIMLDYEKQGYRAYTIEQNGLRSHIRIARGDLTALEVYTLFLESRSLTFFSCKNNDIRMLFVPRVGKISSFESDKFPILAEIKDYTFKSDGLNLEIKKLETFMIKDKPVDPGLQDLLNRAKRCKDCKDCKDGFYYPFAGKREPCKTCTQ